MRNLFAKRQGKEASRFQQPASTIHAAGIAILPLGPRCQPCVIIKHNQPRAGPSAVGGYPKDALPQKARRPPIPNPFPPSSALVGFNTVVNARGTCSKSGVRTVFIR